MMEEEINFREFMEVLIRGRRVIAAIFFIGVLAAGIVNFFLIPAKYEARSVVFFDEQFIKEQSIDLESYRKLITSPASWKFLEKELQISSEKNMPELLKKSIVTSIDANRVYISATAEDAAIAQKTANLLAQYTLEQFRNRLISEKEKAIAKYEKTVRFIAEELEHTPRLISSNETHLQVNKVVQIPQVNPLYDRLSTRFEQAGYTLNNLKIERDYLIEELQPDKGLSITWQPAQLPDKPVSPRKIQNLALGGVLGLMTGVFLVFFREFL